MAIGGPFDCYPPGSVASCCLPGGPCHNAGLADVQHRCEPPPERVWLVFSDGGGQIRKWSREPFEGATEYAARSANPMAANRG